MDLVTINYLKNFLDILSINSESATPETITKPEDKSLSTINSED